MASDRSTCSLVTESPVGCSSTLHQAHMSATHQVQQLPSGEHDAANSVDAMEMIGA